MSDTTLNLTPQLYKYMQNISLREAPVLKKLREQTHKMSESQMQISPEQGQFFQLLMQLIRAKNTLEIGVYTGYSTLAVALALPSDSKIIACDINKEWTKIAQKYWDLAGVSERIDLRLAPAIKTLEHLLEEGREGTFDFAFIDADKTNYLHYYELCLKLLRPTGLLAIDNTLWSGDVADEAIQDQATQTIRKLNLLIFKDDRVSISLLPIGDGLTLVLKK